ncbi:MAG: SOS response-associated peptidase [Flavobacteriaceae bacterium]
MCFHAQQTQSQTAVHQRYGTQGPVSTGIYNGFSHPQMTVIIAKEPKATTLYHWGLIPHWAKDKDIRRYTLNAKVETMAEKPSFRSAKRCLIVTDGFYEWQWQDTKGKKKQKYLITHPQEELFAFAGLHDEWIDRTSGEIVNSFAIVTTAAQGIMQEIHNSKLRMPLTLSPGTEASWLAGEIPAPFFDFTGKTVN